MAAVDYWPIDWDALPGGGPEPDVRAAVGPIAAEICWCLAGRRFGLTVRVVRPIASGGGTPWRGPLRPAIVDGAWRNEVRCVDAQQQIALDGPVHQVVQVVVGAVVLPAAGYTLLDNVLVRADGGLWPLQRAGTASGSPSYWSITYLHGLPVPPGGQVAAAFLAAELARARSGGKCRLPGRVQSVAREGVDVLVADPTAWFAAGLTGVPETDQWLAAVNPGRLPDAPRVFDPGAPRVVPIRRA